MDQDPAWEGGAAGTRLGAMVSACGPEIPRQGKFQIGGEELLSHLPEDRGKTNISLPLRPVGGSKEVLNPALGAHLPGSWVASPVSSTFLNPYVEWGVPVSGWGLTGMQFGTRGRPSPRPACHRE